MMQGFNRLMVDRLRRSGTRFMPFADVATAELPLARLLRLAMFQMSVAMAGVLLAGTLNRVMIVELEIRAALVSAMVALPILVAPFRALNGFRSDRHRSAIGWRRVPYVWFGAMIQFSGLAIMPFALLLLSPESEAPAQVGVIAASAAFLLVGAGMQVTQTAGLALACDLASEAQRPRVVALMYVVLLAGSVASALIFSFVLEDFTPSRLVQVVQSAALLTIALNIFALWKQEPRDRARAQAAAAAEAPPFRIAFARFVRRPGAKRFLVAVALGTLGFNMQDIVLEPYGGEILGLNVGETTFLTAFTALGGLCAFALAARILGSGADPVRLAGYGALIGIPAFACVFFSAPLNAPDLFRAGTFMIGFGNGLFAVGTLTAAMGLEERDSAGLALGAWGAVQATAAGLAIFAGGALRDLTFVIAGPEGLGPVFRGASAGYGVVYHFELLLLFLTLVVIGPLAGHARRIPSSSSSPSSRFGLAELPG